MLSKFSIGNLRGLSQKRFVSLKKTLVVLLSALTLTACGGGSSDNTNPSNNSATQQNTGSNNNGSNNNNNNPTNTDTTPTFGTYNYDNSTTANTVTITLTPQSGLTPTSISFVSNVHSMALASSTPSTGTMIEESYNTLDSADILHKYTISNLAYNSGGIVLSMCSTSPMPVTCKTNPMQALGSAAIGLENFSTYSPFVKEVYVNNDQKLALDGACPTCADPGNGKQISAYLEEWAYWKGNYSYSASPIPFNLLNNVIYAFADFVSPSKVYAAAVPGNNEGIYQVHSADNAADPALLPAISKAALKYPYLKTFISFGGWQNDNQSIDPDINFEFMSPSNMQTFANQAVTTMRSLGFNGIDIDWEWWQDFRRTKPTYTIPAWSHNQETYHSTQNYINLLQALRTALNSASQLDGKQYYLSIAINPSAYRQNQDTATDPTIGGVANAWTTINSLVDYLNLMAYDMHGQFDSSNTSPVPSTTSSGAPWAYGSQDPYYLYSTNSAYTANNPSWNPSIDGMIPNPYNADIQSGINNLVRLGVTESKIVVGMPGYARSSYVTNTTNYPIPNSPSANNFYVNIASDSPPGEGDSTGVFSYKCIYAALADETNTNANLVSSVCAKNGGGPTHYDVLTKMTKVEAASENYTPYGYQIYDDTTPAPSNITVPSDANGFFITFDDPVSITNKLNNIKTIAPNFGGVMLWAIDDDYCSFVPASNSSTSPNNVNCGDSSLLQAMYNWMQNN